VNVFDTPGSSDLTANVDFAYLKEALEGTGMSMLCPMPPSILTKLYENSHPARPLGPLSQMQFLLSLGMGTRVDKLIDSASSQERKDDISGSAKRLVDPLGMGAQYQVMGIVPSSGEGHEEEVYPFIAPPAPTPATAPAARGATKQ
jgi:NADH dehydrogenase [ubiquinone] 1 alpha subcomplex assembly factor 7